MCGPSGHAIYHPTDSQGLMAAVYCLVSWSLLSHYPMSFPLQKVPDKSKRILFPNKGGILLLKSLGITIVHYKKHQTPPLIVEEMIPPANISCMSRELNAHLICLSYMAFNVSGEKITLKFLQLPPEFLKLHCMDHLKQITKAYSNFSRESIMYSGTSNKIHIFHKTLTPKDVS